jgi:hypothetical protein
MPQTITIERPTYRYTIPETARGFESDPKTFGMKPITAAEERRANEIAEGAKTPLAPELVRLSVCELDGKPVDWNTDQTEWFERCSPKVRQLVYAAFAKVNRPSDDEESAFLGSQVIAT